MKIQDFKHKNKNNSIRMGKKHKSHISKSSLNVKSKSVHQSASSHSKPSASDDSDETDVWQRDVHLCSVVGAILLAIYVKCLYPSVPGGDSGELIVSAHEIGVAHPPGYPLFTMLSKLFMTLVPIGSPAWRVNLLTAICSAAAGALVQFTVLRITGCIGSSLLAVGLFSLNKLTWTWSVTGEVFGLNNLFIAAIMATAVVFEADDDPAHVEKLSYLGSFLCGLSLCNQHTIVVYVVTIAFWVCLRIIKLHMVSVRLFFNMGMLFVAGLTPYLYLPLSTSLNSARWSWGDHSSTEGVLTHLMRKEYGTFDLGKQQVGLGFLSGLKAYWEHTHTDLCELGPFLALIGITVAVIWRLRGEGTSVLVFSVMLLAYVTLFTWRANLDISNALLKGVVERFWMQSDLVMCVLAGVGFYMAVRLITETALGAKHAPMSSVFSTMGAAIIIMLQLKNLTQCDESGNFVVHDFSKTLLKSMPRNAIVLSKGDLPTNTLRYFHLCENVRPDLSILDVEVLSYGWFLPLMKKFYPKITFPGDVWQRTNQKLADGRQTFNFRAFLDNNQKYPIFACIGMQNRDPSWSDSYITLPYGPCLRVVPNSFQFDPVRWANTTASFSDDWPYPHNEFQETSWEKVANDEMWQAKIGTAFFMYQQAMRIEDKNAKTQLLLQAYHLYFRAIKRNQIPGKMVSKEGFPHFWYKNFALTCEKLLHVDHELSKAKLCKLAISNFKQYVHLAQDDDDRDKIEDAILILQQRLQTIQQLDKAEKTMDNMARKIDNMGLGDLSGVAS